MLDVHPSHHTANTWRDFFTHIATIVIGLLIAVGLEQMVEYIHHRHQVTELREQLLETLENNVRLGAVNRQQMGLYRTYIVELQAEAQARRLGHSVLKQLAPDDPRMQKQLTLPSLAPYEAAKQNGSVALLPSAEIRLYNRMGLQREFYLASVQEWFRTSNALEAFEQRFTDSKGSIEMGNVVLAPDLTKLTKDELVQFEILLAAQAKTADLIISRDRTFTVMCKAVLDGARDENQLIVVSRKAQGAAFITPDAPADTH